MKIKCTGVIQVLNETAKIVLCLDLSSRLLNMEFDDKRSLKIAKLTKTAYQNNKRILEKVLNLNKILDINEICIKAGLSDSNVKKTAKKILEAYKKDFHYRNLDFDHPQYVSQAVYQACKVEKVKITKKKMQDCSNLKPAQWISMETEWDKWLQKSPTSLEPTKKEKTVLQLVQELENETSEVVKIHKELKVEDYDVWKKRILEQAYEAIKKQKQDDSR